MDPTRLKILEVFRAGGIYALRGYTERYGRLLIRTYRISAADEVYRVDLMDIFTAVVSMVVDEVEPTNAADRFEELRLQVVVADSLFGWM